MASWELLYTIVTNTSSCFVFLCSRKIPNADQNLVYKQICDSVNTCYMELCPLPPEYTIQTVAFVHGIDPEGIPADLGSFICEKVEFIEITR